MAPSWCRDVAGCQQTVVSEYTHTSLSPQQQSALVEAFGLIQKTEHNGVSVGTVLLAADERVAGMARFVESARMAGESVAFLTSLSAERREPETMDKGMCPGCDRMLPFPGRRF